MLSYHFHCMFGVDQSLIQWNNWAAWIRKFSDFSQKGLSLCNNFWFLHHYLSITFSSSVPESRWLQQSPKWSAAELWQVYQILLTTGINFIQNGMFSYVIEWMYNFANSTCDELISDNHWFSSVRFDFLRVNCIIFLDLLLRLALTTLGCGFWDTTSLSSPVGYIVNID